MFNNTEAEFIRKLRQSIFAGLQVPPEYYQNYNPSNATSSKTLDDELKKHYNVMWMGEEDEKMKYSEVKVILQILHQYGWEKIIREPAYRKIWVQDDYKYQQIIPFHLLRHTKPKELEFFLRKRDESARMELLNYYHQQLRETRTEPTGVPSILKSELTSSQILGEVFFQRNNVIAKYPNSHKFHVYLGTSELSTILNDNYQRIEGIHQSRDHWKLMGMRLFEVMTDLPHIKVTAE